MTWVVDASAAVEVLMRSHLGDRVWGMIAQSPLLAPDLLDAEVLAVLRREVLARRLDARRAREALDDLRDWDIVRVPSRGLVHGAWRFRANVSAYDALYLAAAQLHGAQVITTDGPLARAPSLGVAIHCVRR